MIRILTVLGFLSLISAAHAADSLLADENPAPTLGTPTPTTSNTTTPTPTKPDDTNIAAPSSPEAQPSVPLTSIPGKTDKSPSPRTIEAQDNKDIYEQYDEYLEREKERQKSEKDLSQRSLFPHENGAWQLGFAYTRNAFSGYDYNWKPDSVPGSSHLFADYTQGFNVLVTWFPIHSLSVGRFGVGVTGGMYWSKLTVRTPSGGALVNTTATPQNVITYGARAVYEFDYLLGQILVPYAFVGVDEVGIQAYSVTVGTTKYVDAPRRQLVAQNYGGGVHFNLNRVEPVTASRGLVNVGIRKFYLSYMATQRSGALAGLTHSLALNFEF